MKRMASGVPGFDELVEGGFPEGASVLISGGPGAGKTIFAMQYIYEGARSYNEPGLYVTLETGLKDITWNMQSFRWDIKSLQDKNMMKIYRLNFSPTNSTEEVEDQISKELSIITKMVDSIDAKRLVIDSTTAFGVWVKDHGALRHLLFEFVNGLKDIGCTTLLTSEVAGEDRNKFSAFGVEEFVVDGVVALYFIPPNRSIFVRKLRGTDHSKAVHAFDIEENGIVVRPKDEIPWGGLR
ncbi:MAG: ATPase domain-containing protein [Candidatus Diapherotrites archaeon]|nr:ATPase domain-containing protein [Candidatus Diapherotrites archaeon]MDZ4256316.1 ATPase domain-containing protein [archaeon]